MLLPWVVAKIEEGASFKAPSSQMLKANLGRNNHRVALGHGLGQTGLVVREHRQEFGHQAEGVNRSGDETQPRFWIEGFSMDNDLTMETFHRVFPGLLQDLPGN